ncbi:hypothetical protein DINM_005900 [Dirofilaria immitis]|nr:hypothetical protein [Dirofilaria immitis]
MLYLMNPNIGNVKMDRYRYSIPFYSIIIISTIIIATTASPTNDIYVIAINVILNESFYDLTSHNTAHTISAITTTTTTTVVPSIEKYILLYGIHVSYMPFLHSLLPLIEEALCGIHILFHTIFTIIISTVRLEEHKSSNHFALYKNEPNNDDSMLDEYFVADKRFQNDKGIKLPPVLIAFEKPVPMNPYSWQYMVKKERKNCSKSLFVDE